jgi:hypothetical protein
MLIHSVYFWFKADADAALVARFEEGLARLTAIPEIQTAFIGRPEATPKRSAIDDTYAWALIETFADLDAHNRYQAHPIHEEFLKEFAGAWQKVHVYDVRADSSRPLRSAR